MTRETIQLVKFISPLVTIPINVNLDAPYDVANVDKPFNLVESYLEHPDYGIYMVSGREITDLIGVRVDILTSQVSKIIHPLGGKPSGIRIID